MWLVYMLLSAFSIIGIFYIIQLSFERLFLQKDTCCKPILVWKICNNAKSDLEMDLKIALWELKWLNTKSIDKVCFVDCDLSQAQAELCKKMFLNSDYKIINKLDFTKNF